MGRRLTSPERGRFFASMASLNGSRTAFRRSLSVVALAWGALAASPAGAQEAHGVSVDRVNVASAESGWFTTDSASFRGHFRPAAAITGDYAHLPLTTHAADGALRSAVIRSSLVLHAGGSLTLFERARLGFVVPFSPWQQGDGGAFQGRTLPAPSGGVGDTLLAGDVRVIGAAASSIRAAIGIKVALPTGARDRYLGDGVVGVEPRATLAGSLGRFEYAVNGSVRLRETVDLAGVRFGNEARIGVSAGAWLWHRRLLVGPEVFTALALGTSGAGTPTEAALGAHLRLSKELTIGAGGGIGVINGLGNPDKRGLLSFAWAPAKDLVGGTRQEDPSLRASRSSTGRP